MDKDILWDNSDNGSNHDNLVSGESVMHNPPYRIPFTDVSLSACHGIPALVVISASAIIGLLMFETCSQYVKPVVLDVIWAEPHKVTSAQILAQTMDKGAVQLHKTGKWNRLCEVSAKQTFVDEHGGSRIEGEYHQVSTPKYRGAFSNKGRDLQIPKLLANSPGIWKVQIINSGSCNPIERFFPIGGMTAEATFEIVP